MDKVTGVTSERRWSVCGRCARVHEGCWGGRCGQWTVTAVHRAVCMERRTGAVRQGISSLELRSLNGGGRGGGAVEGGGGRVESLYTKRIRVTSKRVRTSARHALIHLVWRLDVDCVRSFLFVDRCDMKLTEIVIRYIIEYGVFCVLCLIGITGVSDNVHGSEGEWFGTDETSVRDIVHCVNRESAHDVYSSHKILVVTKLKIVEWHNYKHLEWITFRIDDNKLYTFKEGDYNRLRLQDIEDMPLLLVQGKMTTLNIEERLALGVSLRMFTRSIVIKRHVEDLQLGIESYQKKLNLTNPDTYISDLKRKTPYTAYSNPKRFIYQNKDKKNRLMRIDEPQKFSDGTLKDVQCALDEILKRIQMEYLPQTV
ncbi:hypothetical protein Tco_0729994 [Tanacetum coccineum]|uniref:Uncharacterized protein n=1 Tax=Tanacetum coccineum TaxID=301880 RepID=A0ABQ4YQI0_9ASTR